MFKNLTFFSIAALPANFDGLESNAFTPCAASQEKSSGWVPPRGHDNGALVETVAGQHILKLMTETKPVPAEVVARRTKERLAQILETTGRKPGKKETRDIRDDVFMELLPMAFPKQVATLVWIDPVAKLLVIDSASQTHTDELITQLVKSADGIVIERQQFGVSPSALMTSWLYDGDKLSTHDRFDFDIDRACELRACDESKAVVRYTRHNLDTDEVKQHITQGKMATKLALTYADRVALTLTDDAVLTGINFLDVVFESNVSKTDASEDGFDSDVTIMTGELRLLIDNLFQALDLQEGGAL